MSIVVVVLPSEPVTAYILQGHRSKNSSISEVTATPLSLALFSAGLLKYIPSAKAIPNASFLVIDGNVKKLFTRTQENTEEIELLKKQFNDCNNNIEILQKNNKVNNTNSIEPTLLEQYKIEINKQIQKLSKS